MQDAATRTIAVPFFFTEPPPPRSQVSALAFGSLLIPGCPASGVGLLETRSHGLDISRNLTKSLVIMDEVDGMSTGDRGGVAAIINLIKNSKVPIICICNDRGSEKIRSLAGHCLDVKFFKPNKTMVVKRLKEILIAEGGSG